LQALLWTYKKDSFIDESLIWKRIKHSNEPSHVILFLPQSLVPNMLKEIHGHILASHDGFKKPRKVPPSATTSPTWMLILPPTSRVATDAK
jgi:hypothetical protein